MRGIKDEAWSVGHLRSAVKVDHGFTLESQAVVDLLHVMSQLDKEERRLFSMFLTGSPNLPVGGEGNSQDVALFWGAVVAQLFPIPCSSCVGVVALPGTVVTSPRSAHSPSPLVSSLGFAKLTPPFTVVRKESADHPADHVLPSVMTCQNYLKLPAYSTRDILADKLRLAIREGQGSFHLS